jgi:phospholipid/cholesterol/gamma-HCH transport system substrate-binding protein
MESKRESALVGLFVLVASGLLIATVFLLSGALSRGHTPYRAYFKRVGGISPGAEVRYNMGPPVGRVQHVHPDPADPRRMEIDFTVKPETPVRTDCVVAITSNSPLSDNYLSINCDAAKAGPAPPGYTLTSAKYSSFGDISDSLADLTPTAKELVKNLNERVVELRETIGRVNDLLNDQNRANISSSLSNVRGMLEENRPAIRSTVSNLNASSAKLDKVLDDMKKTMAQANDALAHIDATITENRPDLRASIQNLRKSMASVASLSDQLDRTLASNSENLDEIIENMRQITENMKSFTDTIKTRPYTLIRASEPKPHEPGKAPPK